MAGTQIIAIDFGTAYSGYAYSLTPDPEVKPYLRRWKPEKGGEKSKTPTCVLFDENQTFLHFGYEARDKYFDMHEERMKHYFFKDFKMELYQKKILKDLVIRDVNKKEMRALQVFAEALRFLKEDALRTINHNACYKVRYEASDFTWVLTVPAIWDVPARQFMREAAVQAGIVSPSSEDKLVLALEPEAASVWCKQLPSEGFIIDRGEKVEVKMSAGTQYIVVDCGGGTIDITVHEVLEGGALKELHKASGNDKGGRKVDRKFTESLREFFCDGLWEEYERDHPKEAQQFMEDFMLFRQADHTHVRQLDFYKEFKTIVEKKTNRNLCTPLDGITFHWNKQQTEKEPKNETYTAKLEISVKKMESFFHETLVHITDSLSEILNKHCGIGYILLVGGLSSSHVLHKHIRKEFGHQATVLCPKNPQEAIMKGAVLFGRDQSVISSRKSAFTYGVRVTKKFDPSIHKAEKKVTYKEGDRCTDLFKKLVEVDEDVGWNETREYSFKPIERDQKRGTLKFYRTERKNATYTDDWGVEGPIALCHVNMPDITKGIYRKVKLNIFFGSTEITAVATDVESKSSVSAKMDFITK